MKKRILNRLLKIGILFVGISLLLWNCSNEDSPINFIEQNNNYRQVNFLSEKELPTSVLSFLDKKVSQFKNKISKRSEANTITIELDEIMQVIDTIGNVNYTFRINLNDDDPTTFYNLTVNENTQGEENISYVVKYNIDQSALQQWQDNNHDFAYFTGTVYRYNVDDFFNGNTESSRVNIKNSRNPIDTCPCNIEIVNDGNGNPGSGGGSGGG